MGPNWPWLPLCAPFSVKSALSAGLNKSSLVVGNNAAGARFTRPAAKTGPHRGTRNLRIRVDRFSAGRVELLVRATNSAARRPRTRRRSTPWVDSAGQHASSRTPSERPENHNARASNGHADRALDQEPPGL